MSSPSSADFVPGKRFLIRWARRAPDLTECWLPCTVVDRQAYMLRVRLDAGPEIMVDWDELVVYGSIKELKEGTLP